MYLKFVLCIRYFYYYYYYLNNPLCVLLLLLLILLHIYLHETSEMVCLYGDGVDSAVCDSFADTHPRCR